MTRAFVCLNTALAGGCPFDRPPEEKLVGGQEAEAQGASIYMYFMAGRIWKPRT